MKSLFKKASSTNLDFLLKALHQEKSNFFLTGLVNVESGDISVRSRRYNEKTDDVDEFRECAKCEPIQENRVFFVDCKTCGRSSNNYFWIKSGDGDGVYATFQILRLEETTGEGVGIGLAVVFYPTEIFAQPLVEHALKTASDYEDPLTAFGFTTDILEDSGSLEAFEITTFDLEDAEAVYVADKYALVDSPDAIMCMNLDNPGNMQLTFLAFSEAIGDQKGPYPNDVSPRPRVLIGIDSSWLQKKGFRASMARPDSPKVFQDWVMTGIGACHVEPMHEASFWFNSKINEAMQKYNYAASWLLQGAVHGDKDSINELSRYDEFMSDPEWIKTWLEQRHQFSAALEYEESGKLPFHLKLD